MKKIISGIILAIILFLSGLFTGRFFYPDIKVVEREVYKTKYVKVEKTDCEKLWSCYQSPIQFSDKTKDDFIFVTAFDECKKNTARYKISSKGNWNYYLIAGGVGLVGGVVVYSLLK